MKPEEDEQSAGFPPPRATLASFAEAAPDFLIALAIFAFWTNPLSPASHLNPVRVEAIITLEFFAILSGWFMSFAFMLFRTPVFRYIAAGIIAYLFVIGFGTDFARLTGEAWPILSLLALMVNRTSASMMTSKEAQGGFLFAWSLVHFLLMLAAFMIQAPFPTPDFGLTPDAIEKIAHISPPLTEHAAETMAKPDKYVAWSFIYFSMSGAATLFYLGGLKEKIEGHLNSPEVAAKNNSGEMWTPLQEFWAIIAIFAALFFVFGPALKSGHPRREEPPWRAPQAQKLHDKNMEKMAKDAAALERKARRLERRYQRGNYP
ncbi:MAG: hypothetical protein HZB29_03215 [Nitrospinae bacterium]|nr:hypothetical protein [Nitrospinota bacterium]